jgi:hypothetical protein
MATLSTPRTADAGDLREVRLYSHSPILYWWPVWFVGFLMAFFTYLDGSRMALVPPGAEARRDWRVEVAPGQVETREGLLLPALQPGRSPAHLPPAQPGRADAPLPEPDPPSVHMAYNQYLGSWFMIVLLVVFVSSNVPLRGLWEWVAVLVIGLVISLWALYGWWGTIVEWFRLLHIHINMAGYVFLSAWLFAMWAVTVFFFDTRTYIIIAAGQIRVRQEIGQGEKIYDITNLTFHLQPNVLVRHRILGFFGAGDLVVRTAGPQPEVIDWPNVLFVRRRLKQIEHLLHTREVVQETVAAAP